MQGVSEQLRGQTDIGKQPGSAEQPEEEQGQQEGDSGRCEHCNCDLGNVKIPQ